MFGLKRFEIKIKSLLVSLTFENEMIYREKLLNFTLSFYLYAFSIAVPISLLRMIDTGWLTIYLFHCSLLFVLLTLNFFKLKLPYHVKVYFLFSIFYLISIAGMANFGSNHGYNLYFGLCILISAIFLPFKISLLLLSLIIGTQLSFIFVIWKEPTILNNEISHQLNLISSQLTRETAFVTIAATTLIGIGWLNRILELALRTIKDQNKQLLKTQTELENMTLTDPLTQLPNRRALLKFADIEIKKFNRTSEPFTVLMIDLDFFKLVNDTYGHDAGDVVLQSISKTLASEIREYDIAARYGGEEFMVILCQQNLQSSQEIAQRIRIGIEKSIIKYESNIIEVTTSIGLSIITKDDTKFEDVLKRADLALYKAKENGRNCVYSL